MSSSHWRLATRIFTLLHLCAIPVALGVAFVLGKFLDFDKGSGYITQLIYRETFYAAVWHYWGLMYIFVLMSADIASNLILLISTLHKVKSAIGIIISVAINVGYAATILVFCFYAVDAWYFLLGEAVWRTMCTGIACKFLREREEVVNFGYFSNVPISDII